MRKTDQEYNRLMVLRQLRLAEPVARTDLARLSGLTGGTITAIIADLVQRGLVLEEKDTARGTGRPRVNLRINPEGAYVVGATVNVGNGLLVQVVNLKGEPVLTRLMPMEGTKDFDIYARYIAEAVDTVLTDSPVPRDGISQVAIGLPAVVDNRTGVVEYLETFEAGPFPFAEVMERHLGLPVRLDNNINLLARAEHWFGDGMGQDDFTLVLLELGIGAARYQEGMLALGSHGIEAELGHTKIVPEQGRPCHCGGRGCLQAYSSISGIIEQDCEQRGELVPFYLDMHDRLAELLDRADSGDPAARSIIERAGRYLGIGIANHINLLDPDKVVVLSTDAGLTAALRPHCDAALQENILPFLRDKVQVSFKVQDDRGYAQGAAALALEQIYQSR